MTKTNIAIGVAITLLIATVYLAFALQTAHKDAQSLEAKLEVASTTIDSMFDPETVSAVMEISCAGAYAHALETVWATACELQGKGRDCQYLPTAIAKPLNDSAGKGDEFCTVN